jgi:GTP pyrophosphokinase
VRRFIRSQQRSEYINLGRAILSKLFRSGGREFNDKILEHGLEKLKRKSVDDLLSAVGEGRIARQDVLSAIFPESDKRVTKILKKPLSLFSFKKKPEQGAKAESVQIKGLIPGMALHYAGCCHPLPGDSIVGIVHTGKGVTIHTSDCEMLENFAFTPERWIEVSWDIDTDVHVGRIKAVISHEPGSLATLTTTIAQDNGNISNIKIINRSTDFFEVIIDIEVHGTTHLSNIIASIRSKPCVHSVERHKI